MPLKHGKSQKAFEHNLKTEMHSGKPQNQALAIAYSVKRKAQKKAKGGQVEPMDYKRRPPYAEGGEISAVNEKRPMPSSEYNDSRMAQKNARMHPEHNDHVLDQPELPQARKGLKTTPIAHPKMVPSNAFSTKLRTQEDNLQQTASPGPYNEKPLQYNEKDSDKHGPAISDMENEHSTHKKPYAGGGGVDKIIPDSGFGKIIIMKSEGGEALSEEEKRLMSSMSPSEDEGHEFADVHNEINPNRKGPSVPDMEEEHTTGRSPYAEGGSIQYHDAMENEDHDMEMNPAYDHYSETDSEDQTEEVEEDHHASMVAAIMAKRHKMAEGGQVDLSQNADEEPNHEDQYSFEALKKENYSESDALDNINEPEDSNMHTDEEEMNSHDEHDMISSIRSKMKKRQSRG